MSWEEKRSVSSDRIFPLYVIGRKSGQTIKWRYAGGWYICGVILRTSPFETSWAEVSNGTLCRIVSDGMVQTPKGSPQLFVSFIEVVDDQKLELAEILENSDVKTNVWVGRKDQDKQLIVATLARDVPYKVWFPTNRHATQCFEEGLVGGKFRIMGKTQISSSSLILMGSQCMEFIPSTRAPRSKRDFRKRSLLESAFDRLRSHLRTQAQNDR